jgi:hypothetical protein
MKIPDSANLVLLLFQPVLCDELVRIQRKPALPYPQLSSAAANTLAQHSITLYVYNAIPNY